MYMCEFCEQLFEEDEIAIEKDDPSASGVGLSAGYYTFDCCPHCGSTHIREAEKCASCGDYHIGEGTLCGACSTTFAAKMEDVRKYMDLVKDDFEDVVAEYFGW